MRYLYIAPVPVRYKSDIALLLRRMTSSAQHPKPSRYSRFVEFAHADRPGRHAAALGAVAGRRRLRDDQRLRVRRRLRDVGGALIQTGGRHVIAPPQTPPRRRGPPHRRLKHQRAAMPLFVSSAILSPQNNAHCDRVQTSAGAPRAIFSLINRCRQRLVINHTTTKYTHTKICVSPIHQVRANWRWRAQTALAHARTR